MKTNLAAIGIEVEVKTFSIPTLVARIGRRGEPFDLAFGSWIADYADPDDYLGLPPRVRRRRNDAAFDDPAYARKAAAAARLSGPRRYLAYGALDKAVARERRAVVAIGNQAGHDFFSARIGCQVFQPVYGMDLAALCIRKGSG